MGAVPVFRIHAGEVFRRQREAALLVVQLGYGPEENAIADWSVSRRAARYERAELE